MTEESAVLTAPIQASPVSTATASNSPLLSVIIPAFNEEGRIGDTLRKVHTFLSSLPYDSEIIVVDDGSEDNTVSLVLTLQKELRSKNTEINLIHSVINGGKGKAVIRGMKKARGLYRLFMDADNATPIETWNDFLPFFTDKSADIVIGSRRIEGAKIVIHQPWYRTVLGHIFRAIVKIILPLDITDTQNGFKAFTAEAAENIFPTLETYGWAFDLELLAKARLQGYTIKEVPVAWHNNRDSRMNSSGMWHMLIDVIRIRTIINDDQP